MFFVIHYITSDNKHDKSYFSLQEYVAVAAFVHIQAKSQPSSHAWSCTYNFPLYKQPSEIFRYYVKQVMSCEILLVSIRFGMKCPYRKIYDRHNITDRSMKT